MSDWTTDPTALRGLVARGDSASVLDACTLASTMPVTAVRQQLHYDFLAENAEAASRFFGAWLPRLPAYERMAAADWVGSQYVLSMAHLDHAYGTGARVVAEALAAVTAETAQSLEQFRVFTQGPGASPDAEVEEAVGERFSRLAGTLQAVHAELVAEVAALPRGPQG
jgi:hypothetical protein